MLPHATITQHVGNISLYADDSGHPVKVSFVFAMDPIHGTLTVSDLHDLRYATTRLLEKLAHRGVSA